MGDPISDLFDAGSDAAASVTSLTKKTKRLIVDIDTLIKNITGMWAVSLEIPRSDDELSSDELHMITELRAREAGAADELRAAGGKVDDESLQWYVDSYEAYGHLFVDSLPAEAAEKVMKMYNLAVDIRRFRLAIHLILYHPPGIIPETLANINATIERFCTLEQPRIEAIMDSSDDAIQESTEILVEFKKLFVERKLIPKDATRLTTRQIADLAWLRVQKEAYSHLIDRHIAIAGKVSQKMLGAATDNRSLVSSDRASAVVLKGVHTPVTSETLMDTRVTGMAPFRGVASRLISPDHNGYVNGFSAMGGSIWLYERELLKIEKKITILSFDTVEVPGVIPETLDDIHLSVERFNTIEQPKIEKILDVTAETITESQAVLVSVDSAVTESKNLIVQLNTSVGKVQGWFDFLSSYRIPILVGCAVFGFLTMAIMVAVLIVLIKIALA